MRKRNPETIEHVKSTRYAVARRYGRVTIGGDLYLYDSQSDTLVRFDIFKERRKNSQQLRSSESGRKLSAVDAMPG